MSEMTPKKMKVAELRAELEKRGLDVKGNKAILIQRLEKAVLEESGNDGEVEAENEEDDQVEAEDSQETKGDTDSQPEVNGEKADTEAQEEEKPVINDEVQAQTEEVKDEVAVDEQEDMENMEVKEEWKAGEEEDDSKPKAQADGDKNQMMMVDMDVREDIPDLEAPTTTRLKESILRL